MIEVSKVIEFTTSIRPACLETDLHDEDPKVPLIVTGWGTISAESNSSPNSFQSSISYLKSSIYFSFQNKESIQSNALLKAKIATVPLSKCNATYMDFDRGINRTEFRNGITSSQYCAQDPAGIQDSCQGDSGGPLQMFKNHSDTAHVVGIVSFGVDCGTFPGIYTRIAYFLKWIESHVWPST